MSGTTYKHYGGNRGARYTRRRTTGGVLAYRGGNHLGDSAKGFLDGIADDLAADVSEKVSVGLAEDISNKVTASIFEKLSRMFSQAASAEQDEEEEYNPEEEEEREEASSDEEPEDQEPEDQEPMDQEPEYQEPEDQEPIATGEAAGVQQVNQMEEPMPQGEGPVDMEEQSQGEATEQTPQGEGPVDMEEQSQGEATEQMPQEEQPAFNGDGGPAANPIPNNKITGGRRSMRNYGYYNSRRSRNNRNQY